jgi:hypothetical protein
MKTLKIIVLATALFIASAVQAQVSVSVNFSPPSWGPVGYNQVRYYYLPDVEAYYDVQSSMFIYSNGGVWVHRAYLPERYRNYDLYGGYKVVMNDYRGNAPYTHFNDHKRKYYKGYHGKSQRTIGERPGKGHSGVRNSHQVNHGNQGVNRGNQGVNRSNHEVNRGNQGVNRGNGKSVARSNDKGNSHGNNNKKNDRGNGGGNGRNK